jgi:hypothetical protein
VVPEPARARAVPPLRAGARCTVPARPVLDRAAGAREPLRAGADRVAVGARGGRAVAELPRGVPRTAAPLRDGAVLAEPRLGGVRVTGLRAAAALPPRPVGEVRTDPRAVPEERDGAVRAALPVGELRTAPRVAPAPRAVPRASDRAPARLVGDVRATPPFLEGVTRAVPADRDGALRTAPAVGELRTDPRVGDTRPVELRTGAAPPDRPVGDVRTAPPLRAGALRAVPDDRVGALRTLPPLACGLPDLAVGVAEVRGRVTRGADTPADPPRVELRVVGAMTAARGRAEAVRVVAGALYPMGEA